MKIDEIKNKLERLDDSGNFSEIVTLWNVYASECCADNEVFSNDEDFFGMCSLGGYDLACRIAFGDWLPSAEYVTFNGYGNIVSFDFRWENNCPIDLEELAEHMAENPDLYPDCYL